MDSPPLGPDKRRPRGWAKRCEQCCWSVLTRFPLVVVYGLTTWAVWVEIGLSLHWTETSRKGYLMLFIGVALYALLNWSYTTSAFTDPGSPLNGRTSSRHQYSHLPTDEPNNADHPSLTVKSTGGTRFCKKCQCKKPDRAHHCSTCRRCVLKMDHHCPWLATCVGLRNYKAFLLFLTYTTLFCWTCFGVSLTFVWTEIASEAFVRGGGMLGINMVMLAVLSGIIGIVLTGFTAWHFSLAMRNQTTIECLEKTRYSTPIRKTLQRATQMGNGEDVGLMQRYGQQLAEIHANAIPGVTRIEEGEEHPSPSPDIEGQMTAMEALRMNYNDVERERERERYEEYLDEKDSEKLPNAFDLGWRRNLVTLFGDKPLLWFFPVCNTLGDGWRWEPSPKWVAAREAVRLGREEHWREQEQREREAGWGVDSRNAYPTASNPPEPNRPLSKADRVLGRHAGQYADEGFNARPGSDMSMKTFKRYDDDTSSIDGLYENEDAFDDSSDEAAAGSSHGKQDQRRDEWRDWE